MDINDYLGQLEIRIIRIILMSRISAQELRIKYLEFFKSKGHALVPSASLVPENDSSILFTTAGMHPLVPFLMGQEHPQGKRIANVQKCIRTGDIEEVGDDVHLTFFEMLGNWSFGDSASPDGIGRGGYFKKDAISWSFEFLTSETWLNLALNRLAISVFQGDANTPRDAESAEVWKSLGVPEEKIAYLPKKDNWWIASNSGPCGPDTEIFYWVDDGTPAPSNFQKTKDDPRWVEIWNDVFMQYEQKADGKLVPLKQKNVDTGMGLDRTLAVLNGQNSVYDTELFKPMFDVLELKKEILSNEELKKAKIILDHVKASVFIVCDGVEPSNKDRGYVLRRLLRRAMVFAKLLNLQKTWLKALIGQVIFIYSEAYNDLPANSEKIFSIIEKEQNKFEKTLERGLKEFEKKLKVESSPSTSTPSLSGKDAFDLYQTYGFPWELTKELAESSGQKINKKGFEEEFKKHQELSRTASAGQFKGGLAGNSEKIVKYHTATHLLNAALRKVLGSHIMQKGSNITEERTRFDFSHPEKISPAELAEIEFLVNSWVERNLPVKKEIMPLEEAKKTGALGVFGEKYGDTVSVYTIFDSDTGEVISKEFCGGPHVEHTGIIGNFKILKEEASSAGVRRIKAAIE